jgi:hypothetical protein
MKATDEKVIPMCDGDEDRVMRCWEEADRIATALEDDASISGRDAVQLFQRRSLRKRVLAILAADAVAEWFERAAAARGLSGGGATLSKALYLAIQRAFIARRPSEKQLRLRADAWARVEWPAYLGRVELRTLELVPQPA